MAKVIKTPLIRNESRLLHTADKVTGKTIDTRAKTDIASPEFPLNTGKVSDAAVSAYSNAGNQTGSPIRKDDVFHDALRLANEKLEKSEYELNRYKSEIQQLKQEASEKAYKEGYEQGFAGAKDEISERISLLNDACSQLTQKHERSLDDAEDDIVEIIYSSVCKLLCDSSLDSNSILPVVKRLAGRVISENKTINVHVSSSDYNDLAAILPSINENALHNINFISDDRVEYGGCIVESNSGNIDARLDVQLQKFKEILLDTRRYNPVTHSTS